MFRENLKTLPKQDGMLCTPDTEKLLSCTIQALRLQQNRHDSVIPVSKNAYYSFTVIQLFPTFYAAVSNVYAIVPGISPTPLRTYLGR